MNTTYHILGRRQTARYITFSNSYSSNPPLFILTVCNWQTIKFHYSPLHSQQSKFLNTLMLLAVTTYCFPGDIPSITPHVIQVSSLYLSLSFSVLVPVSFSHVSIPLSCYANPLQPSPPPTNSALPINIYNFHT
jgi:hypothetical protein